MTTIPFARSYWVIPGLFLAGAHPGSLDPEETARIMQNMLQCGVRQIINLMEETETDHEGNPFYPYHNMYYDFAERLGMDVRWMRMPIRDLPVPSPQTMRSILDEIDLSIAEKRPVYVHCWGGVGRTGTVVGCHLVRSGLDGEEALVRIKRLRRTEVTASRPSPETETRRNMVRNWQSMDSASSVMTESIPTMERYRGSLLGLAAGDALGTTLEFKPAGSFQPIKDIVGGGPFRLKPGAWTDDTSMALCLAESLIQCGGFDPGDQMDRYLRWYTEGYLSSNGSCCVQFTGVGRICVKISVK